MVREITQRVATEKALQRMKLSWLNDSLGDGVMEELHKVKAIRKPFAPILSRCPQHKANGRYLDVNGFLAMVAIPVRVIGHAAGTRIWERPRAVGFSRALRIAGKC